MAGDGSLHSLEGPGLGDIIGASRGMWRLDAITLDDPASLGAAAETLGAGEMAAQLEVAGTSLDTWRRADQTSGFETACATTSTRSFGRSPPVEGLGRISASFADDKMTWDWLVTANPSTGVTLDILRRGGTDEVARATEGALDYR